MSKSYPLWLKKGITIYKLDRKQTISLRMIIRKVIYTSRTRRRIWVKQGMFFLVSNMNTLLHWTLSHGLINWPFLTIGLYLCITSISHLPCHPSSINCPETFLTSAAFGPLLSSEFSLNGIIYFVSICVLSFLQPAETCSYLLHRWSHWWFHSRAIIRKELSYAVAIQSKAKRSIQLSWWSAQALGLFNRQALQLRDQNQTKDWNPHPSNFWQSLWIK